MSTRSFDFGLSSHRPSSRLNRQPCQVQVTVLSVDDPVAERRPLVRAGVVDRVIGPAVEDHRDHPTLDLERPTFPFGDLAHPRDGLIRAWQLGLPGSELRSGCESSEGSRIIRMLVSMSTRLLRGSTQSPIRYPSPFQRLPALVTRRPARPRPLRAGRWTRASLGLSLW